MSVGPYYGLMEAVVKNAIISIAPVLVGLKDENDVLYNPPVPLRAAFSTAMPKYAEIILTYQPGKIGFQQGKNQLLFDDKNGIYYYGFYAEGSRIKLTIKARSDSERIYLADALISGIVAGFSLDNYNNAYEGSILDNLGSVGIILTGIDGVDFPDPDLGEARQEGQVYQAVLTLACQVWHQWSVTPGSKTAGILIKPSVTAYVGPGVVVQDATIAV